MKYKINLFGITRDIVGNNTTEIEMSQSADVQAVLGELKSPEAVTTKRPSGLKAGVESHE